MTTFQVVTCSVAGAALGVLAWVVGRELWKLRSSRPVCPVCHGRGYTFRMVPKSCEVLTVTCSACRDDDGGRKP